MSYEIHHSDCIAFMQGLPSNHVDAIVTDPPYELGFMGKGWDKTGIANSVEMWAEALRVLKPGGHLLAFSGSRTYHRMTCAIEDAGFEVRDQIMWLYGSGFPKSMDVSKAIDKAAGAEREVVGYKPIAYSDSDCWGTPNSNSTNKGVFAGLVYGDGEQEVGFGKGTPITAPATPAAKQWQGWGTALKPAHEPICVARKPLIGTVAENVLTWGTGGVNVDGCRVVGVPPSVPQPSFNSPTGRTYGMKTGEGRNGDISHASGRWPANVIHDGSEEVLAGFPERTSGGGNKNTGNRMNGINIGHGLGQGNGDGVGGDSGSAARFFYCAKASKADRGEGNNHPTVKPAELMRYLCRLVTPPGGLVFDPFTGSGSTGKAAILEGFRFLGCDMTVEYVDIARARIEHALRTKPNQLF